MVFDLDGTLVDSRRDIADAANDLLVACGAAPLAEDAIGRMVGDGAGKLVTRAFAAAGALEPADALDRFLAIYDSRLTRHTRPYAGIPELLAELRARRLALGVLTNKPLGATREMLDAFDLARFFAPDDVLGGDGPLPRKPDPAGLLHLAARAGTVPSKTLLVGDSVIDWRTAMQAGAAIALARYGFGYDTFPIDCLTGAEALLDHPLDLLTRL